MATERAAPSFLLSTDCMRVLLIHHFIEGVSFVYHLLSPLLLSCWYLVLLYLQCFWVFFSLSFCLSACVSSSFLISTEARLLQMCEGPDSHQQTNVAPQIKELLSADVRYTYRHKQRLCRRTAKNCKSKTDEGWIFSKFIFAVKPWR